jgi:DNA-binding response OmpR family regulator
MRQPVPPRTTILLVEDDQYVANMLTAELTAHGYTVQHVRTGNQARAAFPGSRVGLVILDLRLPDMDGLILCSELKQVANVPVIICSGRAEQVDRVVGLRLGADDFIAKPFDMDELLARVEAVLRRRIGAGSNLSDESTANWEIRLGGLVIDIKTDRVSANGQQVHLTPTEHRLLVALASQAGQALTRDELAKRLWPDKPASSGAINFHICRLRAKLARTSLIEPAIVSVRHLGYKLEAEPFGNS